MKLKKLLAALLGTFLLQHAALSQTNTTAPDQSADTNVVIAVVAGPTNPPVVVVATADSTETNTMPPAAPSIPRSNFRMFL